jgi:hypothetical protein
MAHLIDLSTFTDRRGHLTVIEKVLPFEMKRIFYIYDVKGSARGGHRHKTLRQAAICLHGNCMIGVQSEEGKRESFFLNTPSKCLILEPEDWHYMYSFAQNSILMIIASDYFDPDEYIFADYGHGV